MAARGACYAVELILLDAADFTVPDVEGGACRRASINCFDAELAELADSAEGSATTRTAKIENEAIKILIASFFLLFFFDSLRPNFELMRIIRLIR